MKLELSKNVDGNWVIKLNPSSYRGSEEINVGTDQVHARNAFNDLVHWFDDYMIPITEIAVEVPEVVTAPRVEKQNDVEVIK